MVVEVGIKFEGDFTIGVDSKLWPERKCLEINIAQHRSQVSQFWKDVSTVRQALWSSVDFRAARRLRLAFWLDLWCYNIPLANLYRL